MLNAYGITKTKKELVKNILLKQFTVFLSLLLHTLKSILYEADKSRDDSCNL